MRWLALMALLTVAGCAASEGPTEPKMRVPRTEEQCLESCDWGCYRNAERYPVWRCLLECRDKCEE